MKKLLLIIAVVLAGTNTATAVDNNTVEIVYNGSSATVTIASNISNYVTVSSGSSSHVKLIQSEQFAGINPTVDNTDGEIIYILSGTSTDGEFYLEGSFKCTVELNGLTLTNPSGPALNIQDGKRISLSAKKGTTNSLSDGLNENYNGCIHCKGHLELKGKGTLNVSGNSKHGIYSKEYMEIKNLTLNVTSAVKDALHCKEFFWMKSGTISLSGASDDGIQVELSSDATTAATTDHEDENTGNFYQDGGVLTIQNYQGKAVKADGTITYNGGTQNFDTSDTEILSGIRQVHSSTTNGIQTIYDLNGRQLPTTTTLLKGIYIVKKNGKTQKVVFK